MRVLRVFLPLVSLVVLCLSTSAKEKAPSSLTMMWPDSSVPTLKLTFGRFVQQTGYGTELSFVTDVLVQNVSLKRIPRASLSVRIFDKDKVRIGDAVLNVTDLSPNESTKLAFQFLATGVPASLQLAAHNDSAGVPTSLKTVPLKIVSVPPGAKLRVDGQDAGTTPRVVDLLVGTHILEFSKEGYASGSTPVDVAPDELAGGSVTFEMGGISQDVLELRDGSTVLGDVISVSMTSVVIRVNGEDKTYDRNKVKKISLVERKVVQQPTVVPASQN
jgi:PEGA domain-containing protein